MLTVSPPVVQLLAVPLVESRLAIPFYTWRVPAGFPSPAEEHLGDTLDLNALLIKRPAATFFVRISGDSLQGAGIQDGDILVVDRSIKPRSGHVVIAIVDGDMTAKILERNSSGVRLLPANPRYPVLELKDGQELDVWGVVCGVVREGLAGGVDVRIAGCE